MVALGGAAGAFMLGIAAPLLLPVYYELELGLTRRHLGMAQRCQGRVRRFHESDKICLGETICPWQTRITFPQESLRLA